MKNLSKETYLNLVKQSLAVAGGTIFEDSQTQFRCQLPGNKQVYRIFFRYRCFPDNESKLTHFLPEAYNKLLDKTPDDEIPCLANVGHYSLNGRDQIVFFVIELSKINQLEQTCVSNIFSIGSITNRHIVRQPQTLADELELEKESILYGKIVLPKDIYTDNNDDGRYWE